MITWSLHFARIFAGLIRLATAQFFCRLAAPSFAAEWDHCFVYNGVVKRISVSCMTSGNVELSLQERETCVQQLQSSHKKRYRSTGSMRDLEPAFVGRSF